MNPVFEALSLLTPFDVDKPKIRLGPDWDGGYVFMDDITPDQTVISYGISTQYGLDAQLAERGHKVFMFDHTVESINATSANMLFFREGVAARSSPEQSLFTIEDHILKHRIDGDHLILKMDVEGAEFDAINAVSRRTLDRFDQIVLEIHHLARLGDATFREKFCKMLRSLNKHHTLFHVHANNFDGHNSIVVVDGFPTVNLIELSYVKSSLVQRRPSQTLYPTPFDFPNVAKLKEKLLWFYPFLPTATSLDEFAACRDRVDLIHTIRNR